MFKGFLQQTFLHNRILDYLICLSVFLIGIIVIQIFKRFLLKRLRKWAKRTATTIDDFLIRMIEKELLPLFYFGAFYVSIQGLTLNPALEKGINVLGLILLTIFGVRFLLAIIVYGLENYWVKKEKDVAKKQGIKGILMTVKVIVWGLAIIVLLDNFGIKVSALIAGLGIGGVAIALAAQSILGDLFSYFSIFFDRPFKIGDFIIVGDLLGTVEHIGIKTTRVRSLGGEQLVFSNTDLTNSRVRNYKRMDRRRVVFRLGVTYETGLRELKEIPVVITNIIKGINDTVFDRAHFFSYGDFSLVFEIVYYVIGSDYNKYMDIQQEINLKIKEEFEKHGIEFAYPTQTLYLNKT
ncbi:mechanosensitive ion channel family protein [Candidatus Pacearchaeota archaeon]|nr:mechanosensitive ion channel family protein [Candidatus Pacearchaeota archaeon]